MHVSVQSLCGTVYIQTQLRVLELRLLFLCAMVMVLLTVYYYTVVADRNVLLFKISVLIKKKKKSGQIVSFDLIAEELSVIFTFLFSTGLIFTASFIKQRNKETIFQSIKLHFLCTTISKHVFMLHVIVVQICPFKYIVVLHHYFFSGIVALMKQMIINNNTINTASEIKFNVPNACNH